MGGYRPVTTERAQFPGRAQIALAVPPGSRRLRGRRIERSYLDALTTWEPLRALRADAREHVLGVAKQLARRASYEDGTTRRGRTPWSVLASVSTSTWKRARRLLEGWGFLACVVAGTTEQFRPMALQRPDVPNTAAVYVLCVPRTPPAASASALTGPPTASGRTLVQRPAPAREAKPGSRAGFAGADSRAAALEAAAAAAAVMRKAAGQTISEGWCAWIWQPFALAGWTARDLAYAIDHPPGDVGQHRLSAKIRHPVGWLRHRLGLWMADVGRPLRSRSEQLEDAAPPLPAGWQRMRPMPGWSRQVSDAIRRGWRPPRPAATAPADPAPWAARIRLQMGWKSAEHEERTP